MTTPSSNLQQSAEPVISQRLPVDAVNSPQSQYSELPADLGVGFCSAFEYAAIGMALVDLQGHCLAVNRSLCDMLGCDESELLGQSFQSFTHPDDRADNLRYGRRLIAGEINSFKLEKRYIDKAGRTIWVLLSASLVPDTDGTPLYVISQIQDISERKRAEDALRASEERYRSLVETSPDAIVLTGLDGKIMFCNAQDAALLGFAHAEEMVGRDAFDFIADEDRARALENLKLTLETGATRGLEYTLTKRDGTCFSAEMSASVVRDAAGMPVAFIGVVRDISRRKRAGLALRESEERYRRLVESSPDLIAVSAAGKIVFMNPAGLRLMGAESMEQVAGRSVLDFNLPSYRAELAQRLEALARGDIQFSHREQSWLRLDGTEIEVELAAVPFIYHGEPAVQVVAHDITGRKRALTALRQSEERYRAIVEDQTELVCRFNPDTALTFVNEAYCRYFGKRREELIGQSFLTLGPPEDHADVLAHLASLVTNPRLVLHEHTFRTASGERRWQEWTDRPIFDDRGNLVDFHSVGRDITERKLAEIAEREQRILAEALRDSAAALNSALSVDQVLDRLMANASRVVPHDATNIMLVDPKRNHAYVARAQGYSERGLDEWVRQLRLPLWESSDLRKMMETGQPLVIPDVTNDPNWIAFPQSDWLRSYAAAPIRIKGQTVGFLNFDSATPGFFTPAQLIPLQAFADQAAVAIENARLFEATRRSVERSTTLHQAGVDLAKAASVDGLYREVLHWARLLAGADIATLTLFDGMEHLVVVAAAGMPDDVVGSRITIGQGLNGCVAQSRQAMRMPHYDDWEGRLVFYSSLGVVSAVGLPLIWQDRLVGTLVIADQRRHEFDDDDMHMLNLFASLVAAALEQRRAVAEAQTREAEANALSSRLSHAQEEERVRIAEQLHDSIGYRLVTLQKNSEATLAALGLDHPLAERLADNLKVLQETHQLARTLATDLNSKILADLGISPAARQYIDRMAASTGMNIRLHVTGRVRRLPADVERVAFRSLQETVVNALRHACATEVSAQMHFGGKALRLTIQDNGSGFDPSSLETNVKGTALGLPELRRQVHALRGEFLLESAPGQGTVVVMTLPFHIAVPPEKAKSRVLLVDDHVSTRQGLRLQLVQSDEFTCAGEAGDGISAIHQVELNHPDLVIMDISLPHLSGIEAARQISKRFPHVGIIMFSYHEDEAYLQQAFQAGARGYLVKTDDSREVINALKTVRSGAKYVSPRLAQAWERLQVKPPVTDPLESLTMREREVFQLIVSGNPNRCVAEQLGISVRTIEVHRKNIMGKLGVKNVAQLMQFARRIDTLSLEHSKPYR